MNVLVSRLSFADWSSNQVATQFYDDAFSPSSSSTQRPSTQRPSMYLPLTHQQRHEYDQTI
jgi:hypothetical protein